MKNLFRNCIYQGKNLYRDKSFLFWTLMYPLIMAIFFYTAFNGIMNVELENINIGIKDENPIGFILEEIEFLNVHKISEDEITEKLENEEIEGFVENDLSLLVKKSGMNQTIIKEVLDQIKQMGELKVPIERFDFNINYVSGRNQKADVVIIIFYSLIAMVSAYGIFPGITTVSLIQANLTNVGKRINVAPLRKNEFLLAGVIVALILNLLSNALLLIFIKYVLKIDLFTQMKYSAIFIIIGNLFGVALGIFIGASNKQNENVKALLGVMITLFLSALSGMMSPNIKILIDEKAPIINRLNPIGIITNNLYRINLLENTQNVSEGVFILSIYCLVLISISYVFLRRKTYDSI
ncbi:ABC transporter permease [Proteiniborus sp. MB09-C3]|uniref:ABC transporter permease n=1 Tax=Proteiniborus sp. MB09-C3 TaxID=3050072 RepID=UPI002553CB1F|nr:ABC transporter permease [Proteiniborus sp. MB09-C3]WIV12964.1 ABC transporter permease [Proteiniborus sp. MB09-C3]